MATSRSNCWPDCPDSETLFGKALLIHGPYPPTGWSVTRRPNGTAAYVNARGKDARAFNREVIKFFAEDIRKRYSVRRWGDTHRSNVARRWKNQFNIWIWERIDANK